MLAPNQGRVSVISARISARISACVAAVISTRLGSCILPLLCALILAICGCGRSDIGDENLGAFDSGGDTAVDSGGDTVIDGETGTLVSISIEPPSATLPAGASEPFIARGHYSDGTSGDVTGSAKWSSDDVSVATVDAIGKVTAVRAGSTIVRAVVGAIAGTAKVLVPSATLTRISVDPKDATTVVGTTVPFTATAFYSDGSSADATKAAAWSTLNPTVATVDAGGVATAIGAGGTQVRASLLGSVASANLTVKAKIVSITVAPATATVAIGGVALFNATATFSDGSTANVTKLAAWTSGDSTIVTVSFGSATGVAAGATSVTATLGGLSGSAKISVTSTTKTLTAISVSPASATIPAGATAPFTALGLYSDGSTADVTTGATWSTSTSSVATVDSTGHVTAVSPGGTVITASIGSISGAAKVFVPKATLTSIKVDPNPASTAVGGTVTFSATALFSDGTSSDVTTSAAWTVDDATVATLVANVATGAGGGTTKIHATLSGVIGTASLSVSAKTLKSIDLTPFNPTVGVSVSVAFKATATYSDGTTADVTTVAAWTSSDVTIATVATGGPTAGNAKGVAAGTAIISATVGGVTGTTSITVTGATVTGISVSPSSATLAVSGKASFVATATYSDGSSVDVTASALWTSSDATIATVSGGNVTGVAAGTATITASFGGKSGTASITVSAATLKSITITPADPSLALGGTIVFKAVGLYSDGSTIDITTSVVWSTDDATVATISNAAGSQGKATPVAAGKTTVRATVGSIAGSTSLTVTTSALASIALAPNPLALVQGDKGFMKATGTYSDGSTLDLSATCTWSSSDATIAVVSNASGAQGQVTAVGVGTTTISCVQSGVTGSATVTVSSPVVTTVSVTPISPTCRVGDILQFTAMAITSGGTGTNVTFAATWTTSDSTVLPSTGFGKGRYKCSAKGTAIITATYAGVSGSSKVTVTDAVVTSLQVDPAALTLAPGTTQQYQATAFYSDGTSTNVTFSAGTTWVSSAPAVASISTAFGSKGRATTIGAGSTTIQATFSGVTGSTSLTVTSATIVSISITPASRTSPAGTIFNYSAQAIYSDGTSKDVTGLATWVSSDAKIAQVSDAFGSKGRATLLAAGSVTITATYSGVSGTASLTVSSATLSSIQVTPFAASVPVGIPIQYRAEAIYSDGTSVNVTGMATWTSTDSSVAAVSDAFGSKGFTTTLKSGSVKIHANWSGLTGEASLTVTTAKLTTIQVFPFKPSVPVGFGIGLTATAVYDDGSTFDVTGLATWTSSAPGIAAVSDGGGSKGRVTPISAGVATISATWSGTTGTDSVTVTSATLSSIAITPSPATVAVGGSQQLVATGTFSDGTTLDITIYVGWSSSDASIADVSNAGGNKGLAFGFKIGTVTATATRGATKGTVSLTVK